MRPLPFRLSIATSLLLALGACRKEAAPHAPSERRDFYGVQFEAPPGTDVRITDGVLPGPGGQGGIPTGARPSAVLILPGPRGFYVELVKTADPVTLEGMKFVLSSSNVGSKHEGKTTSTGWELTYETGRGADGAVRLDHILYADLAGGHYQCIYADANCGDPSVAEAICRSLRPKPVP